MPTNEERKALAKRLRTLASHAPADAEMVLDALDLYPGEYVEGFDPRCVDRLADLIEPQERTCRVDRMEVDEFGRYFYLSCGHMQMTHDTSAMPYCPNCGCRVKED